jgi:outer membrane protein OmpA-like peptidoglycan-associated protein
LGANREGETFMNRSVVGIVGILVTGSLVVYGCGSKKTTTGGTSEVTSASSEVVQEMAGSAVGPWDYDAAPTPAFEGNPDYRLTSFGFSEEGTDMKPEAVGACREAVKQLADKPEARLLAVGFADGIKENANAEKLGMQRAEAARNLLASLGIKAERVQVASFGSRYSTAKDFEKLKMGLERKVEIWVLK